MQSLGAHQLILLVTLAWLLTLVHAGSFSTCKPLGPCYQTCSVSTPCLDVPNIDNTSIPKGNAIMFLSANTGTKFQQSTLSFTSSKPSPISHWQYIDLNTSVRYQTITAGFGAAFTDAAVINLYKLDSAELQSSLLEEYYGSSGAKYTLGRIPIGGSDFSTKSYSDDNVTGDTSLQFFNLSQFDINRIAVIKQSLAMAQSRDVKLFASPWTAPPWLKVNTSPNDGYMWGSLSPNPVYRQTWAEYLRCGSRSTERPGSRSGASQHRMSQTPFLPSFDSIGIRCTIPLRRSSTLWWGI